MSFTHNHDNFEATEPLGIPRFLDDFEDNGSLEGPMTEPDVLRFVRRVGLSDPHGHMPVPSKMPGVKCPRCAEKGIEQWVLPGKHCPRCNQPC